MTGTALHLESGVWRSADLPTSLNIYAVWGVSEDDVFAVGQAGRAIHFDGTRWLAELDIGPDYYGVWGTGEGDVWAVGNQGRIVHRAGAPPWFSEQSATTRRLNAVWGESAGHVYAVGDGGEITERVNNRWARGLPRTSAELFDVCGLETTNTDGEPVTDLYAVGAGGTILHRDVDTGMWEPMDSGVGATLYAVAVARNKIVFAVGGGGVIVALLQGEWRALPGLTTEDLFDIGAAPDGELFVAGGSGARHATVLFYGPKETE
jgi:hypothetical protein